MGKDIENLTGADATDFKTVSRAQAVPMPFFGDQTQRAWVRPAATDFPDWLNQAPTDTRPVTLRSASVTDNPNELPLILLAGQDSADYFVTARLQSVGAGPWTIDTAQAAFSPIHSGLFITYPIVLYNSVDDKAVALTWYLGNATDGGKVTRVNITDATAPGFGLTETNNGYGFPAQDYFEWFRVENDGTNIKFSLSPEGKLWMPLTSLNSTIASFIGTIDKIGFGVERLDQNSAGPNGGKDMDAACIVWSWVQT